MRHSIQQLIEIAHRYHPLDLWNADPAHQASGEHQRLRSAIEASIGSDLRWREMLDRLRARFPECLVEDRTHLYVPSGTDACYYGRLLLPKQAGETQHPVVGLVSILVPYYFVFCRTMLPDGEEDPPIRYQPMPSEEPYVRGFSAELESAYGYEPMPPDVGLTVVPRVMVGNQRFGEATVYDCLFTDFRW